MLTEVPEIWSLGKHMVSSNSCTHQSMYSLHTLVLPVFVRGGKGLFASAKTSPAYQWCSSFGSSAPVLHRVAINVLQPAHVSAAGAPVSVFIMHLLPRSTNRLEPSCANDLVYEFSNLRLLKRAQSAEYDEEYPE